MFHLKQFKIDLNTQNIEIINCKYLLIVLEFLGKQILACLQNRHTTN